MSSVFICYLLLILTLTFIILIHEYGIEYTNLVSLWGNSWKSTGFPRETPYWNEYSPWPNNTCLYLYINCYFKLFPIYHIAMEIFFCISFIFEAKYCEKKLLFSYTYRFFPTRTLCFTEIYLSFLKKTIIHNAQERDKEKHTRNWIIFWNVTRCKFIHTT